MSNEGTEWAPPRVQFVTDLVKYRVARGLSKAALARRMSVHPTLVGHVELGRRPPTPGFARAADAAFGLDSHFTALADAIYHAGGLGWFARWVEEVEPRASTLWTWDPLVIPGLLQTEDYSRAIFQTTPTIAPSDVDGRVRARRQRQRILDRADAPRLLALVDESVLLRPMGGTQVLRAQLRHLVEMAERPRVTVQLVPIAAGHAAGMMSAFALARLADGAELASVDSILSGAVVHEAKPVGRLRVLYDSIRAEALPQGLSLAAISDALERTR